MSSVIADVVEIEAIHPHPNADRLFLARIKGWQAVIRKREDGSPEFAPGERVVFIPPDSTLPREMAERLGVVSYLSERTNVEGGRDLVVRRVRLRGEPSFGLVVRPDDPEWPVGTDVREHYGIGKFRPPVRFSAGDAEPSHPLFQRYTDIENLRNFPDVFAPGEEVVVSEKIHGTNARIGWVEGALLAGSHGLQRKRPEPEAMATNTYWSPPPWNRCGACSMSSDSRAMRWRSSTARSTAAASKTCTTAGATGSASPLSISWWASTTSTSTTSRRSARVTASRPCRSSSADRSRSHGSPS